jgi:AraC-like DNA-binding protein
MSKALLSPLQQWSSLRLHIIWVYIGDVPRTLNDLKVDHRQGYWLWLVRKGTVRLKSGAQEWSAHEGQWILCPQAQMTQHFSKDAEILSLHFTCEWPTGEQLLTNQDCLILESEDHPRLNKSAKALARISKRIFPGSRASMFEQKSSFESFLQLQAQFISFMFEFMTTLDLQDQAITFAWPEDQRAARAIQVLKESPLSAPLPLQRVLKASGLSRVHLDRLLTTQFGYSIREYWNHLRESSACHYLENTQMTTKEISYHLGFKQASHFTTWFKRRKKLPPEAFRAETTKRLLG